LNKRIILAGAFILLLLSTIFFVEGTIINCGGSSSYTNCGSYGCFTIIDSSSNTRAIFDGGGFLDIEGSITQSSIGTPNGNDFIIRNSASVNKAWVDDANGNMRIAGTVSDDHQIYCTPPANSFIIKDSSGNCVAYIDSSGNVWLRGRLCYNANI